MKHRIPAALAALAACALTCSAAFAAPAGKAPIASLSVSGSGSVTRAPDRATVSLRIETTADAAATATSENARIADALDARLATLHVPASAITTAGYALTYNPRPPKPDPASSQRYGYTAERTVDVVANTVDSAGAVVDAAVAAGVTGVNGVTFSLGDRRAAVRAAQTAALADAVAQARNLAAAAHVRLVRILAIAPAGGGPIVRPLARVTMAAAVPTTIEPGNLTVDADVGVTYEIAPQ